MSQRLALRHRRNHITQKVKIARQGTLYLSVHDDEQAAEIFLRLKGSDCSSKLIDLYDVMARLMSLALKYGGLRLRRSASSSLEPNLLHAACIRARSPQALFEFAGSDWPALVGGVLRASRAGACPGRRAGGQLAMISRARARQF